MPRTAVEQGLSWTRALIHGLTCKNEHCGFGSKCRESQLSLLHVLGCSDAACPISCCLSLRKLLQHFLLCEEVDCPLCSNVWEQRRDGASDGGYCRTRVNRSAGLAHLRDADFDFASTQDMSAVSFMTNVVAALVLLRSPRMELDVNLEELNRFRLMWARAISLDDRRNTAGCEELRLAVNHFIRCSDHRCCVCSSVRANLRMRGGGVMSADITAALNAMTSFVKNLGL